MRDNSRALLRCCISLILHILREQNKTRILYNSLRELQALSEAGTKYKFCIIRGLV